MNRTESTIRLAAIKLISRNGYESMSLRQLAAESGVNVSTLYLYYKSKSELLLELILEYLQSLDHEWNRNCPAANVSASIQLRSFISCHIRYHLEHQDQAMLGNLELRSLDEESLSQVCQARQIYLKTLQDLLEQGAREGAFVCADSKQMARTLLNMLTHACVWYQADERWGIDEVIRHYSELVMRMLSPTLVAVAGVPDRRPSITRRVVPRELCR